jgi:hypothetical protein
MNVQQIAIEINEFRDAKRAIEEVQGVLTYLCEGVSPENPLYINSEYRGAIATIGIDKLSNHEEALIELLKEMLRDEIAELTETCTKAENNIKELAK